MSELLTSRTGKKLYNRLPAIYRERDQGDLANYIDAFGIILDQIHLTLKQQLVDNFVVANEETELATQAWLLPYFSDLFGMDVLSTEESLQRKEVISAMRWIRSKGTLRGLHEISETLLSNTGTALQEGWQRVAMTPRIYAKSSSINTSSSTTSQFSTITPKVNCKMDVVITDGKDPEQQNSTGLIWRYENIDGVPNMPDSFADVSRRTADLRTLTQQTGYYHPQCLILHVPSDPGFFHPKRVSILWEELLAVLNGSTDKISTLNGVVFSEQVENNENIITTIWSLRTPNDQIFPLIRVEQNLSSTSNKTFFHDISAYGINLMGDIALDDAIQYGFDGFVIESVITIKSGWLKLTNSAVKHLTVSHSNNTVTALEANSCLFETINITNNSAVLEYCTILQTTQVMRLYASDCIFVTLNNGLWQTLPSSTLIGCVRYSCIPHDNQMGKLFVDDHNTITKPIFLQEEFGKELAGMLSFNNPSVLLSGSENFGELGAYHHRSFYHRLKRLHRKLEYYIPLGVQLLLKVDSYLFYFLQKNQP